MRKTEKTSPEKKHRKSRVAEIANLLEGLITALILAFLFRAFVMEAYRIPTGSMADTLMGAHFRLRCPQCGYKYDYGFVPQKYRLPEDTIPQGPIKPTASRCPSCGHYQLIGGAMPIANGDRILVLKCLYQFFEPRQWDIVVFKNPLDPTINYIKRLVARPGETVEIIDGDIYIDGQISRKPTKIQNELWMPLYDNDYQPVRPKEPSFNNHTWQQPFKNIEGSKWRLGKDNPTIFRLDSHADQVNSLIYDTSIGNELRATYAYDDVRAYSHMPYCSDLMVRFYAQPDDRQGLIGIELSKYQTHYKAWVDSAGEMVIEAAKGKKTAELARKPIKSPAINKPTLVRFANIDHQLIFQFGSEKLTHDLGRSPEDAGPRKTDTEPQVKILGSGKITLSHIAIFRDIHYTAAKFANSPKSGRAIEGNPFALRKDEFFVLGDNSPNSEDGRWWSQPGRANNGLSYRKGIVPRDYLVGKAMFVYWPSGFNFPWPQSLRIFLLENGRHSRLLRIVYAIVSWKWVPNIGRIRFIYGGSDKKN